MTVVEWFTPVRPSLEWFGQTEGTLALIEAQGMSAVASVIGPPGPAGGGGGGGVTDGDKGDIIVSGSGEVWVIEAGAVTPAKQASVVTSVIIGRVTAGTGAQEALTAAQARTLLNVADGATANLADSFLRNRTNHTSTQLAATISDFAAAADVRVAAGITGLQPLDADLTTIAGLTAATDSFLQAKAGAWSARTLLQVKTDLGLTGTNSGDQTITLSGDATGTGTGAIAVTVPNATIIGKVLTGFTVAGTRVAVVATDTILAAFGKVQKYLNDLSALAFSGSAADLTGTKTAAFISDFSMAADARIAAAGLDVLSDVVLTASTAGQVLKYNGTNWINDTDATGGGGVGDGDKGDITVSGAGTVWTIDAGAVTLSKQANIATASLLGRVTAATGVQEVLTPTQARTLLNVADGATVNATDASLRDRATHTGTQLAATISNFDASVTANAAVTANTAKVTNATHTGDATGATALTLATVNSNVGSFGLAGSVAQFVVNAKGLTTSASNVAINIASNAVNDFASASRAETEAELLAGTNITITPSGTGATRQLTIAATGGGGSTSPMIGWFV